MKPVNADRFVNTLQPALAEGDLDRLLELVHEHWDTPQLCSLLKNSQVDVRRLAALVLGLISDRSAIGHLTRSLHDSDEHVHHYAEDALWSIWFRAGQDDAFEPFGEGLDSLAEEEFEDAVERFRETTHVDPEFAEAFNQWSIAAYMLGHWAESREAAQRAIALMPTHFGALAGLGHCHAHLGQVEEAIDCYRRALAVNPRMDAVLWAKRQLEIKAGWSSQQSLPEAGPDVYGRIEPYKFPEQDESAD
jgi:tetratricopeptide (TPR) repeat protein